MRSGRAVPSASAKLFFKTYIALVYRISLTNKPLTRRRCSAGRCCPCGRPTGGPSGTTAARLRLSAQIHIRTLTTGHLTTFFTFE